MKQNYPQRLEMQIPQENSYTGMYIIPNKKESLNEFLTNNFEFPSNNLLEINEFISKDLELEKIIKDLPEIISKEFSERKLTIDFSNESCEEIDVTIFTDLNGKISSNKQSKIDNHLFDNYNWDAVNKILVCVELKCLN